MFSHRINHQNSTSGKMSLVNFFFVNGHSGHIGYEVILWGMQRPMQKQNYFGEILQKEHSCIFLLWTYVKGQNQGCSVLHCCIYKHLKCNAAINCVQNQMQCNNAINWMKNVKIDGIWAVLHCILDPSNTLQHWRKTTVRVCGIFRWCTAFVVFPMHA